jgi:hypothetical protein
MRVFCFFLLYPIRFFLSTSREKKKEKRSFIFLSTNPIQDENKPMKILSRKDIYLHNYMFIAILQVYILLIEICLKNSSRIINECEQLSFSFFNMTPKYFPSGEYNMKQ